MKNYTLVPNNIGTLNFLDVYRFTCLSFTPRKNGYTDSTFKQIAELTKDKSTENIKDFVERLKLTNLLNIETVYDKSIADGTLVKRNRYNFPAYKMNYRMITSSILDVEDLDGSQKGFMISLFTLCLNNTKICKFSQVKIAELFGVHRNTVTKYIKELIELGYISKIKGGFELVTSFLYVKDRKMTPEIIQRINDLKQVDKFESIISKTKWSNVKNPTAYLNNMEAGLFKIKKETIIIKEIIL